MSKPYANCLFLANYTSHSFNDKTIEGNSLEEGKLHTYSGTNSRAAKNRNMGGSRMTGLVGLLIVAMGLLQCVNADTKYTVGDSLGWTVPPNNSVRFYEDWAANKTFQIGDTLVFNWTGTHTATEVSDEEEYNNCTKTGIVIVTSGVNVPLAVNGTRYFVCSVGTHCEQGMKVAIRVGNGIAPRPLPPSAASSLTVGSSAALVSFLFIFFFGYM